MIAVAHLDDFELAEFFGSAASEALRSRVMQEISRCESCRRLVAALADEAGGGPAAGDPLGRYAFRARLGSGAWGAVHRAYDTVLERPVAIKLVHLPDGASVTRRALAREGQLLARCHHPNVVEVFDAIEVGEDLALIMEVLPGGTLDSWLDSRPEVDMIVQRFAAAGRGLAAAHAAGVVHGDFKPRNVLLDGERVVLADFGLGHADLRVAQASGEFLDSLVEPTMGGTPGYLAPELLRGESATPLSDQFAFAVSLSRALEHSGVPRHLRSRLRRMMDPEPGKRYESMATAVDALEAARPSRVPWVVGVLVALAGVLAQPSSADTPRVPRGGPLVFDEDGVRGSALADATTLLEGRQYAAALLRLEKHFDFDVPETTLAWAQAANVASKAHGALDRREEQERLASMAADVAAELGESGLAADALLSVLQVRLSRPFAPDAAVLFRRAEAYSQRAQVEPGDEMSNRRTQLELELARAAVLSAERDFEGSLRTLGEAVELGRRILGPGAHYLSRVYAFRAKLRLHLGERRGAEQDAKAALEILEATRGVESVELVEPLRVLMHIASATGDYERGLELATRSVDLIENFHGDGLALAGALKARGGMEAILLRLESAERDLARADALLVVHDGTELERADISMNLARVRGWQGRADDGLILLERARVKAEEAGRVDMVARCELERCRILTDAERDSAAATACAAAESEFTSIFGANHPALAEIADIQRAAAER